MAMMMTGRVLLVCALCVLWCGAAVVVSATGGEVDATVRSVPPSKGPLPTLLTSSLPGSHDLNMQLESVADTQQENVEEILVPATESSEEEEADVDDDEETEEEEKNALEENGTQTTGLFIKQNETPQTRGGERSLPAGGPPPSATAAAVEASAVGEADGGLGEIDDSGRTPSGGSLVGTRDISRGAGETSRDSKGSEGTIYGPPSAGASSSPISNKGDALQKAGVATSTQDTTSLKTQEQSGPTASSEHAPLNSETPERSNPDTQQQSTDTQENEASHVADGDTTYSGAEQSAVRTKNSSGVPTTTSNAPPTPHVQPPAERLPPPADSTAGDSPAAPETVQANNTATPGDNNSSTVKMSIATVPGDSDSSTAVSHTTSPLLL
ncbi:mucin-associated surface protein (MASP), putative, partial [Trypanosoma cruzi marinkellei]